MPPHPSKGSLLYVSYHWGNILNEGNLLFLNQNVTQEIEAAGKDDITVNLIILPEFFDQAFNMIEQENVLRDFLISALSQDTSLTNYLHFQTKDILPVQNLLENMIWTLIEQKTGTNTINQISMGLLFMNLSAFADNINQNYPNQYEQTLSSILILSFSLVFVSFSISILGKNCDVYFVFSRHYSFL